MNFMCYIPARGGSKGIPRKNVKELGGKPLLAYSVAVAAGSQYVSRIIVDTDDADIAAVARQHGAEVPYLRPAHLAGDAASPGSARSYCIHWLWDNELYQPDIIVTLFATSPFRTPADVDRVVEMLLHGSGSHVQTVAPRVVQLDDLFTETSGGLVPASAFLPPGAPAEIPAAVSIMLVGAERYPGNFPVDAIVEVHDPIRLIDIDTPDDFLLAEQVIQDGLFDFGLGGEWR